MRRTFFFFLSETPYNSFGEILSGCQIITEEVRKLQLPPVQSMCENCVLILYRSILLHVADVTDVLSYVQHCLQLFLKP
jgi:hypothetical protein